jgi:hypothetical protein
MDHIQRGSYLLWSPDYPLVVWSIHRLGGIVTLVVLPPYRLSQSPNRFRLVAPIRSLLPMKYAISFGQLMLPS